MATIEDFKSEISPEQYEKIKKQTVWLGCVSIFMLFTGIFSAYVVQSSDKVWVKLSTPEAFTYSTIIVVLSSISLYGALLMARKNKQSAITGFVGLTLLLGMAFGYFQYQGWTEMVQSGNMVSGGIINDKGMYGKDYRFTLNGADITHDGQNYFHNNEPLSEEYIGKLQDVAYQICGGDYAYNLKPIIVNDMHGLGIKNMTSGVAIEMGPNGLSNEGIAELTLEGKSKLFDFALSIYWGMEYFKNTGEYGKDFSLLLNTEALDFENKKFYYKELELSSEEKASIVADIFVEGQQCKIEGGVIKDAQGNVMPENNLVANFQFRAGKTDFPVSINKGKWTRERIEIHEDDYQSIFSRSNTTSSYLWVLTVVHFLHIFGGLIFLVVLFINALNKRLTADNHLRIKTGGIYWHFLGGLWLLLFFFFQYIH